jgi:myo-inositol-1(or 4)-monophosphatase
VQSRMPGIATEVKVTYPPSLFTETWKRHLDIARQAEKEAGNAIEGQFWHRTITTYKGPHDVQLKADIVAQGIILAYLAQEYKEYGLVAEEGPCNRWPDNELTWAVDPLDGKNNFGYGIAHCAVAISLFRGDSVVLALVSDPLTKREFFATEHTPMTRRNVSEVPLRRATVSLVTSYSQENQIWGGRFTNWLGSRCKRVTTLWAPALDLALIAGGTMDGMVCHGGALLDVCGGTFLVKSAGGHVVGLDGRPVEIRRSMHQLPLSFVAARSPGLARALVESVRHFEEENG